MKKKLVLICIILILSTFLIIGCDLFKSSSNDKDYFPIFEVEVNDYYDLGFAIGQRFEENIQEMLIRQAEIIATIGNIVAYDSVYFYENLLATAELLYPGFVDEIRGTSDGSGVEFDVLMRLNMFGDIIALYYGLLEHADLNLPDALLGCSTVSYNYDGTQYLAHNEDGFASLHELMSVIKVSMQGKPDFINLYYPGLVCGVGPSLNDEGLAFSGNYIQSAAGVPEGIPHLFIYRALLEAESVDDAIAIIVNTLACNDLHVNIASGVENRVVSVEKAETTAAVTEVEGLYAHTNHFIQDAMLGFPTDDDATTLARYTTLMGLIGTYEDHLADVDCDVLHGFLCEVAAEPDTLGGLTGGMTLGTSIFNMETGNWELFFNDPADNNSKNFHF